MNDLVSLANHYRKTITDAIAIWESMDDFDDPAEVVEQVIYTLREGLKG